jgi:hypothetical protein
VSGEREIETGLHEMSSREVTRLTTERGSAPRERRFTRTISKVNTFRGNFQPLTLNMTLDLSSGYHYRELLHPFDGAFRVHLPG